MSWSMTRVMLGLLSALLAGGAALAQPPPATQSVAASLIEPVDAPHRNCGGACLKSGSLQWYCGPAQSCALSSATAPARMLCNDWR